MTKRGRRLLGSLYAVVAEKKSKCGGQLLYIRCYYQEIRELSYYRMGGHLPISSF